MGQLQDTSSNTYENFSSNKTHTRKQNTMASMTVANKMTAARGLSLKQRTSAPRPARFVSVRAAPEPPQAPEPTTTAEATTPPPPPPAPVKKDLSFGDAMAFAGPAPETQRALGHAWFHRRLGC